MTQVFKNNFQEVLPQVEQAIKESKFISIDTEFTALSIHKENVPSLFDTPEKRYTKLRNTVLRTIPIQIGITTFSFDADKNQYNAQSYNFHVWPRSILNINRVISFETSTFNFFCEHGFDYNEAIYKGIPFLNESQEKELFNDLRLNNFNFKLDENITLKKIGQEILTWFSKGSVGDETKYSLKSAINYKFEIQYYLRSVYTNELWTWIEGEFLHVKKVSKAMFDELNKNRNLEQQTLLDALGFTLVYRILKESKKPIVGHNMLLDLLHLYHSFDNNLPESYKHFKKVVSKEFAKIFDTKSISFTMKSFLNKNAQWTDSSLSGLYNYFKQNQGKQMFPMFPSINLAKNFTENSFHNAGFDSYCTGFIFIHIAYFLTAMPYSSINRVLTCTEQLAAVDKYKNCVNLIRSSKPHINLSGKDPKSKRPPMLVARSKTANLFLLTSMLSKYGFVNTEPLSQNMTLIAVDNHFSYRAILKNFSSPKENKFYVEKYEYYKHGKYRWYLMSCGSIFGFCLGYWGVMTLLGRK